MNTEIKEFVLSDENQLNAYGFYVSTEGMNIDRFLNNPVMLDTHNNTSKSVLGKWDNVRKEIGKVLAKPIFDIDDDEAANIAGKVERGFINGASVGLLFDPSDLIMVGDKTILSKSELIEASICAIPSNPNALQFYAKGNKNKALTESELKKLCLSAVIKNFNIDMNLQEELIKLLGLENTATDELILEAVKKIVKSSAENEEQAQKALDQKLSLAIQQGKINATQKQALLSFAKVDPAGFNTMIDNLPAKKSLANLIVPGGTKSNTDANEASKPKSEWNLDDYRKYAPKELAANPKLYNELVQLKYNN